ncbi:hypothetical protein L1987_20400 [Smallanthus sonchifolius]|uniref:Uncharacterized protein n=1 Tax=Smallanthus sonchifolius TaxID=185202 RepID=A0ACB9ISY2_9ASTR|nr:hypothetical protein L1987_20400 [Smallanthus sonchifolius]
MMSEDRGNIDEEVEDGDNFGADYVKDEGKAIATEEVPIQIPVKVYKKFNKELADENFRRNLLDMQTQAYFTDMDERAKVENNMAESEEVIVPDRVKYAKIYENLEEEEEVDERSLQHMAYLLEHGYVLENVLKMTNINIKDAVTEIKSKMSTKQLEKDMLLFILKASDFKKNAKVSVKVEEPVTFEFFKPQEDVCYDHFEEVEISEKKVENDEIKALLVYVRQHKLPRSEENVNSLKTLRYMVKKHKSLQEHMDKGSLAIATKHVLAAQGTEAKERDTMIENFIKLGYDHEIINKCNTDVLRKMTMKLKENKEVDKLTETLNKTIAKKKEIAHDSMSSDEQISGLNNKMEELFDNLMLQKVNLRTRNNLKR